MKVVHIALSNDGGAGIAAYRLHTALRKAGIVSLMLVLYSKNDDPTVNIINTTAHPCLTSGPGISPHFYIYEQHTRCLLEQHPQRDQKRDLFAVATSEVVLEDITEINDADIINLHWVAGVVDYSRIRHIFKGKQTVLTLHAMNDFTGGCYFTGECLKYRTECQNCPQLGPHPFDHARHIFFQKLLGVQGLELTAVSPSRWLAGCAAQSRILSGRPILHIPNGIPSETFRPLESSAARDYFGIDPDRFIVLFGAFDTTNKRKGLALLAEALRTLSAQVLQKITLAGFGASSETLAEYFTCDVKGLGPICNEDNLALIYSMADLFALPSMADNLPNSILEALACGTPVLAFRVGGIPEIVEHRQNGYLAVPFNTTDLAAGVVWCMENHGQIAGEPCTATIRYGYTDRTQALRYISLYQSLLDGSNQAEQDPMSTPALAQTNLLRFMDKIAAEVYPEAPSALHTQITAKAIEHLFAAYEIAEQALVLDVGCGQGVALQHFVNRDCRPVGITLNQTDLEECRKQGYTVAQMDQSFLDFEDNTFDLVWARHVVEHSIFPCYTLTEFARILKPGGLLYLEVPGAETTCKHELNRNHYSILSHTMWCSLLERSGFTIAEEQTYFLKNEQGPDEYWAFFGLKSGGEHA